MTADVPSDIASGIDRPSDFVRRLGGAFAVSSLTEDGIGGLKEELMELISRHYAAREEGWEDGDGDAHGEGPSHQQSIIGLQD